MALPLPLAWFWLRGRLTPALKPRLLALLVLGGLQGALGWAMVASGLVDRPSVSQYRLAAHLLLAVALYAYTVWLMLELGPRTRGATMPGPAARLPALIGLPARRDDLGRADGGPARRHRAQHLPDHVGLLDPARPVRPRAVVDQFFENGTTIQFIHRWLAKLLVLGVLALACARAGRRRWRPAAMALLQLGLGIATILSGVDIAIATAHQAGAVLLLTALLVVRHRATRFSGAPGLG